MTNEYISRDGNNGEPLYPWVFDFNNAPVLWLIPTSLVGYDYDATTYRASGSTSRVFSAEINENIVALKILKPKEELCATSVNSLRNEIQILSRVSHPNIIQITGSGEVPRLFIEFEYLDGGTLHDIIQSYAEGSQTPNVAKSLEWAQSLISGINYLHSEFHKSALIIHRDIKPGNIGFAKNKLKLFDFGTAICVKKSHPDEALDLSGHVGSLAFMAPEMALNSFYNEKVDIYSFGVTLFKMLTGQSIYPEISMDDFVEKVIQNNFRPQITSSVIPVEVVEIIISCWQPDFKKRPSAAHILQRLKAISNDQTSPQNSPSPSLKVSLPDTTAYTSPAVAGAAISRRIKRANSEPSSYFNVALSKSGFGRKNQLSKVLSTDEKCDINIISENKTNDLERQVSFKSSLKKSLLSSNSPTLKTSSKKIMWK